LAETLPPDAVPQRAIAALVRLIINYRLLTVLVSTVYFNAVGSRPVLAWVFVGVGVANLLPLLWWERVAAAVLRHPTVLAIDLVVTIAILLITGIDGPLLSYTFGTAFIAGVLYSWTGAGVFTVLLVAAYWALLMGQSPLASLSSDFQAIVGTPSLYVLLAVGGAAVRDLLVRQARMEAALRAAREQAWRSTSSTTKPLHRWASGEWWWAEDSTGSSGQERGSTATWSRRRSAIRAG